MDIEFKLSNSWDSVIKTMQEVPVQVKKKAVWKAAGSGGKVIKEAAIANAKRIDVNDKIHGRSFDSKIWKYIKNQRASGLGRKYGGAAYRVGVAGTATGNLRDPPTYWRHVEFGTEDTPAQPFLRNAMNSTQQKAVDRMGESLKKSLDEELAKWIAKNKS